MLGYLLTTVFDGLGQGPGNLLRPLFSGGIAFNHAKKKKTVRHEKLRESTIYCQFFVCFPSVA